MGNESKTYSAHERVHHFGFPPREISKTNLYSKYMIKFMVHHSWDSLVHILHLAAYNSTREYALSSFRLLMMENFLASLPAVYL